MSYKVNIQQITPAWSTCNYKFMVRVADPMLTDGPGWYDKTNYIKSVLKCWFGSAVFFWGDRETITFLVAKK